MTGKPPSCTWLHCSACGRRVGKALGVKVVTDLLCNDPICQYQGPAPLHAQRDAFIVTANMGGVGVSQIAYLEGISRQRVYQIIDTWKQGV